MTEDYNNSTTAFISTTVFINRTVARSNNFLNVSDTSGDDFAKFKEVCRVLWLCGIFVSIVGLFIQLYLFYYIPSSRKHDEKVLSLLTSARILNTICEYLVTYFQINNLFFKDILFAAYFQTDVILVSWMFVFSKNLYDKIVLVFTYSRFSLIQISFILFIISVPIGVIGVICLKITVKTKSNHFDTFYHTYDGIKFFVLIINALIFGKILCIAHNKGSRINRNVASYIKAALISFILVCITSLQVFITDLCSLLLGYDLITYPNCVVNSYQVIIITVMFVILARSKKAKNVNDISYTSNTASVRVNLESTGE